MMAAADGGSRRRSFRHRRGLGRRARGAHRRQYGARVMIAEEYRVGGTCVIRGCVPKKLLVYASRFRRRIRGCGRLTAGRVPEPAFDWPTLIANKDREIARLEAAYTATLERFNVALVKSRAVLEDAHTVRSGDRRARTRRNDPDRDRRVAAPRARNCRPRARHLLERGVSSGRAAEAHPDPGRRLYRGGVRLHLCRARQRGDAGLSRREDPARLRRRRARAFARRDARARHHGHLRAYRRGDRKVGRRAHVRGCPTAATIAADKVMFATGRRPNVKGLGHRRPGRASSTSMAASTSTSTRAHRCRISTPWATSPTASTSRRWRSARAMLSPTRCSAAGRRRRSRNVPTAVFSEPEVGVDRPDRRRRRATARQGRHLQDHVPADEGDAFGPRHALVHEAGGRRRDRPRGRLPHRRARRRRDDPGRRHRREDGRDQGRLRRDHGGAPDRGRGTGHHARKGR